MRACMVAYTYYELDNRVKRYAHTLAKRGDRVDVVALRRKGQPEREVIDGVTVHRIQQRVINERASLSYLYKLLLFLVRSAVFLAKEQLADPFDLIHVHSIPDFEVFAAVVPKLAGAKLILDIHDIVPELYATKFRVSQESLVFKMLVKVERASGAFADHVIVANHIWHQTLLSRSLTKEKCSVIMNYPNTRWFHTRRIPGDGKEITLLYPGTLSWHQGVDVAIRAMGLLADRLPMARLHIYGDGTEREALVRLVAELGVAERVVIHGLVSSEEMTRIMASADVGVEPKRNDGFSGDAFSTKILEFMAVGIPVIASRTRVHAYYFNDSVLRFFDCDDAEALAAGILELVSDRGLRESYVSNAARFVQEFDWSKNEHLYLDLVERLIA
ncbi:glycosyltransferase family 4 protein [Geomonas sp. Red32]|uniref:glycosyltransferase family 4 protein n=1 Tax=Geomonas sp. Red32 TaxID=2912856 RepID=UPI00202CF357|nr:glycosyltransferase family 4 protein [Geomonas sp. Red32]MCM0082863.1 glycosyltransferase family 4 protein [Geomonas sp. Red32]